MRLGAVCAVALVFIGGCGAGGSPSDSEAVSVTTAPPTSSSPTSSSVATTETTDGTAATEPTVALSMPPEGDLPTRLVGSSVGGETYVLASRAGDEWGAAQIMPSPSAQVSAVTISADTVAVSTCCEPAAGVRWQGPFEGDLVEIGYGTTTDSTLGAFVSVDANRGTVTVDGLAGRTYTLAATVSASGNWWMPVDAALGFEGLATIATGVDDAGLGASSVYWVSLEAAEFDVAPPLVTITQDVGFYGATLVDRASRIWVLEYAAGATAATRRLVIDPLTGVVDAFPLTEPLADQSIDATGTYVIMARADGRIAWQRFDIDAETILDLPPVDRIDW